MFKRFILYVTVLALASCASPKKVLYLQDLPSDYSKEITNDYNTRIQQSDLLSIIVTSKNPELSQMFNLISQASQSGMTSIQDKIVGYTVDNTGCINFPQLGKISLGGKTRVEVEDYIASELKTKGYVNDAVVTVRILNYKVSVLGEVLKPGSFNVSTDRFTVLDAIAAAGDLTIYGNREKVKVIREEKGVRTAVQLDLRTTEMFNSPYFYLKQNDVVYIEPNKAKIGQSEINQNRTIGTFASILSVLISIVALIL